MVRRGQEFAGPPPPSPPEPGAKKNSASILSCFQQLWAECSPAFGQERIAARAEALSLSSLLCLGRHTVTGLLTTCGQAFQDWSAPYRLFSRDRLPMAEIFSVIRRGILAELPAETPLCVAVDDSLLRKTGLRVPGVAWRRDPLGPHFQTNFVRAQRVLQLSAAVPLCDHAFRMVPISFRHAPTPAKPSRKASPEEFQAYRQAARQARLPWLAAQQIGALRQALDAEPGAAQRPLQIVVDGGYTNETVLKKPPPHHPDRPSSQRRQAVLPPSSPAGAPAARPPSPLWRSRPHSGAVAHR